MDRTIASIIFKTFDWLETENRQEWVCIMVMPDHVHTIIKLGQGQSLGQVLHSMKRFTAREINKHLSRTGSLWQKGYTDWGIRDETTLNKNNPLLLCEPCESGYSSVSSRLSILALQIPVGIGVVVSVETAQLETVPTKW